MIEQIVNLFVNLIDSIGYLGVFILMTLESMIFPVPSEAVMPFAGFLIASGKFSFFNVILFSTFGSIVGSLLSYYIGLYGGERFIRRFGRYFLLSQEHLLSTEKYFRNKGEITIFIGRFIPVVRHLISIPAGIGRMNIWTFSLFTIIGAGLWNTFLAYLGFALENNWQEVMKYSHVIDLVIVGILAIAIIWYLYKLIKNISRDY